MVNIFDVHNDFLTELSINKQKGYLKKIEKFVNAEIISALWTTELNCNSIEEHLKKFLLTKKFANNSAENKVKTLKLHIGIEDMHFASKNNLGLVLKAKPIYVSLTWNEGNQLAGGVKSDAGLKNFGKYVLNVMDSCGVMLDTAHLNERSFSDALSIWNGKVLCSHTGFYGLCKNARNIKDYQIKEILSRNGKIGLCFVSNFLNENIKANFEDVIRNIYYFANKFGTKGLMIGTDFYGTNNLVRGLKHDYSGIKKLNELLIKEGFSEKEISDIFYNNAKTFFC